MYKTNYLGELQSQLSLVSDPARTRSLRRKISQGVGKDSSEFGKEFACARSAQKKSEKFACIVMIL
jgi:hypothetical protein